MWWSKDEHVDPNGKDRDMSWLHQENHTNKGSKMLNLFISSNFLNNQLNTSKFSHYFLFTNFIFSYFHSQVLVTKVERLYQWRWTQAYRKNGGNSGIPHYLSDLHNFHLCQKLFQLRSKNLGLLLRKSRKNHNFKIHALIHATI